ncbi:MAG: adenylate/guanylate cyclase domain-containing protein [Chloroflexi bacterium]|nr:adenylate/guanylate cyclase domain-containing protein [Chloroflexota bacterium]
MFPSGVLTFLFTDVEGSTQLWERHPEAMRVALTAHDAALRSAIEGQRGELVKTTGDGVVAAFGSAMNAVQAALTAQRALRAQEPSADGAPRIRVRMGLHSGEAQARDGDYFGGTLNRAARLMAIGHGGQVLLSGATMALVRERLPDGASLLDLGEQRLKDLTQPEHVYQVAVSDLPREFPSLKSLSAYRHNLPIQLTSFVGRSVELAEVTRLLHDTRLLTLIGPGGTGKTRLSLQAAADMIDHFPDGVWFVELAPITDPAQVEQTIAAVFGVHEQPGVTLARALEDYVRYKQLLVVLDNCEHLIGAAAQAAQRLLQTGPQVKIVSSSREGLAIGGETIYQVPSLGLPAEGSTTPDALVQSEAVRLFVERAQAVQPAFALTAENAEAVCEICRRVDGIPLAIELAAVRVRLLTPAQIASRLREHFRLLAGGSRTALPRQQTLQALIDWSWNLLNDAERAILRRLSVFAGGWTLEAAEAVCSEQSLVNSEQSTVESERSTAHSDGALTVHRSLFTDDVLEILGQLVNKSLVGVQQDGEQSRYRLLETVRQYARDKLLTADESVAVHERHARYFTQLAAEYETHLFAPDMVAWVARFDVDAGNFGAAYDWLAESDPLSALRLANSINFAFQRNSRMAECDRRVSDAIARVRRLPPPETAERREALAAGLANLSTTCMAMGNMPRGRVLVREAVALARELGNAGLLSYALGNLAVYDGIGGDAATSEAEAREAYEISRDESTPRFWMGRGAVAISLSMQALAIAMRGDDRAKAIALAEEAMRVAHGFGNPWTHGMAAMNAARVASILGDLQVAQTWIEQSLADFSQAGDRGFSHSMVAELGHVLRKQGLRAEARAAYRDSIHWFHEVGNQGGIAHQLECLAMLVLDDGEAERAARLFGAAQAMRDRANASMWAHERGDYDAAQDRLRAALEPAALERAWSEGAKLAVKQAIELAVS